MKLIRKRATIAGVVAFCVVSVIYRAKRPDASNNASSNATPSASAATHAASQPSPSTRAAAKPKPAPTPQPSDLPRLDHQGVGLTNCVIRYRAGDHGTAGWAVFASRPDTVELTATTLAGRTFDKSWHADTSGGKTVYVTGIDVPVPLTQLKSVEGRLVDADTGGSAGRPQRETATRHLRRSVILVPGFWLAPLARPPRLPHQSCQPAPPRWQPSWQRVRRSTGPRRQPP